VQRPKRQHLRVKGKLIGAFLALVKTGAGERAII
jgi:hypothetical protein